MSGIVLPALLVFGILQARSAIAGESPRDGVGKTTNLTSTRSVVVTPPPARPVDEAELDRMIEVLESRTAERDESIEYRYLGDLLLQRATLQADVADYRRSADAFAAALDLAPDQADSLVGFGRAALGIHAFDRAREAGRQLLALDPMNADGLALSGDAAFAVGDFDAAARHVEGLFRLRPDDPSVTVRRAQLALVISGRDEAAELAADALAQAESLGLTAPEVAFHLSYSGRQAFDRGAYGEASTLLERAMELSPTDHGILGELARVRAADGRTAEAVDLLGRANAIVPEPDHLFLQADLQDALGRRAEAAASRRRGLQLATVDDDHRRAWARALGDFHLDGHGDPVEGLRIAETELADRTDAGAWDLTARARYETGDLDGAAEAADRALATGPRDARFLYHAAVIADEQGEVDEAVTLLREALALHPAFDPVEAPAARALLDHLA